MADSSDASKHLDELKKLMEGIIEMDHFPILSIPDDKSSTLPTASPQSERPDEVPTNAEIEFVNLSNVPAEVFDKLVKYCLWLIEKATP